MSGNPPSATRIPARPTIRWTTFRNFSASGACRSSRRKPPQPKPDLRTPPQFPRPVGSPAPPRTQPAAQPAARKGARTGMVVEHPKYGTGTVVRREGEGDDAKITVNFPRYGLKKLVEKYAGLKRN